MSDQPTGNFAPPPSSQQTPPAQEPTPSSDQPEIINTEQEESSFFPKEEASKLVGSNTDLHPIEGDPERKSAEFEEQKKNELDAEREEHMRRRSGGGPQE